MVGKGNVTCAKCGVSSKQVPSLTFHRFPLPNAHNSLKAKVWAKFCFPNQDSTSDQLCSLYKQHKMLCGKHFDDTAFTGSDRKRLNKFAIPIGAQNILAELRDELMHNSSAETPDTQMDLVDIAGTSQSTMSSAPFNEYKPPSPKFAKLEMMERNSGEDGKPLRREDYLSPDDLIAHLQSPTTGRRVIVSKVFLDEETTVFDVKIVSKHISDEDVYEESEVINCHVCDVTVPRPHYREHAQSVTHQSKKKISTKFMESLLYDYNLHNENHINTNNSYYCSPCVKLVSDGQKSTHGLSVEHHQAIEKENALNVFVKKFVDTEELQESRSLTDSPLLFEVDSDRSESVASWSKSHQLVSIASGSNDNRPAGTIALLERKRAKRRVLNRIQPTTSNYKPNEPHPSSTSLTYYNAGVLDEIEEFKEYAKRMLDKYKINVCTWAKADEHRHLRLEAPNGNILKVTVDIFHSFRKSYSEVLCQVCDTMVALDEKRAHIDNEKHARLISYHVDNMFRRKISDVRSHDLVGNTLYLTGPQHVFTQTKQINENDLGQPSKS